MPNWKCLFLHCLGIETETLMCFVAFNFLTFINPLCIKNCQWNVGIYVTTLTPICFFIVWFIIRPGVTTLADNLDKGEISLSAVAFYSKFALFMMLFLLC